MSYGKWISWIPVSLLLLSVNVIAQPGFLSIDCGAKTNHTGENNIKWVTDANYIDVGETYNIGNAPEYGFFLHNLRIFPKPLKKSCYQLPVAPNVPYLLRAWFAIGNYSGFKQLPSFVLSIETLGMLTLRNITTQIYKDPWYINERIFVSSGTVLYVCLIRTSESDDPFINAIELRTLRDGMYRQAKPGTLLQTYRRVDFGGKSTLRYPQDKFDRIWTSDSLLNIHDTAGAKTVTSEKPISTNNTKNLPPPAVMQTACVLKGSAFPFRVGAPAESKSLLLIYLAEIEKLNMSQRRSFYVMLNGENRSETITLVQNYSTVELTFLSNETDAVLLDIKQASNSTGSPIINAYESYVVVDTHRATNSQDIEPIAAIKSRFDIKSWISDPCYLIPWEGICCDNRSSNIRISELNLSGRNFTGTVPPYIGQLTALVHMSLANNHLIGALPKFSNLTMLERIHLTNNNLNGTVPEWLSDLRNLKELFIENNNFSGVIPVQLLRKPSLKLRYSGNQYLCIRMHNGKCVQSNSRNHKLSVVLGLTISGAIFSLALIVGIAVHLQKCRSKQRLGIAVRWKKFRTNQRLNEDYGMIMMPNPTSKCKAFTLEEIMAATQNFSRKLGQGGFGSVFFGKLTEGREIAVKVLSLFSRQGIQEFQNEIDLLSRIHHKNLVALLGYCNESRELMLIYDHMSGGSLRDRLYGLTSPELSLSPLNWRTRLKIALDAAQGLEYLHVSCTPKIIHRDIKTSNILLDNYMNGKLADFGLSRMTMEGEASHVTTIVKGTPGYLDPDYFRTQMLTDKSDVFSFGVVLLELICGRPPIITNLPEEQVNIIQLVTPYVYAEMGENPGKSITGEIEEIVDKRMGGNYDTKSVLGVAKLALRCVVAKPSSRPSVTEVVAEIKEASIHEKNNNNNLPYLKVIGIDHGDLKDNPVRWDAESSKPRDLTDNPVRWHAESSKPRDMVWHDNSDNITQEGR